MNNRKKNVKNVVIPAKEAKWSINSTKVVIIGFVLNAINQEEDVFQETQELSLLMVKF